MEDVAIAEPQAFDLACEGAFQAALLPGPKLGRADDEGVIYRQTDACSTSKHAYPVGEQHDVDKGGGERARDADDENDP